MLPWKQRLRKKGATSAIESSKRGRSASTGAVIDCLVRNVSESGALLQVVSPLGIPSSFDLSIDGERTPRPCRVMWRKERQIGVAFQKTS
jgi:hypothetical protein